MVPDCVHDVALVDLLQSELEALRVRHAKEVLDLKTVIAERDDRLNETRENALALESDVNTVRTPRRA